MDGHRSHISDEFMWKCYINDVYLACLPAHSSHFTQPLDMSVFSPLKGSSRCYLEERNYLLNSAPIGKQNFLRCYSYARSEALRSHIIKAGWAATGLWPVNVTKPLMSKFIFTPAPTDVPRAPPWKEAATDDQNVITTPEGITVKTPKSSADLLQFK